MIKNNNKGFSLIELMVVVGIIGILASVAVPNLLKFQAKAKQTNAKTELTALYGVEKAYFVEYNTYTPNYVALGFAPDGVPNDKGTLESVDPKTNLKIAAVAAVSGCPASTAGGTTTDRISGVISGWPVRYYASGFTVTDSKFGVPSNLTNAALCTTTKTDNTYGTSNLTSVAGTVTVSGFAAQAIGNISSEVSVKDTWAINQSKELLNTTTGY